jgi:hypothetical protein
VQFPYEFQLIFIISWTIYNNEPPNKPIITVFNNDNIAICEKLPTNDARLSLMIGVGVGSQYSQVKYMAMLLSRVQLGWGLRC